MFSTREQQHFFNCPYQLAIVPPKLIKRGAIMDRPADADVVEMTVESNDLVLLATDGMFDNLFDKVRIPKTRIVFVFGFRFLFLRTACSMIQEI